MDFNEKFGYAEHSRIYADVLYPLTLISVSLVTAAANPRLLAGLQHDNGAVIRWRGDERSIGTRRQCLNVKALTNSIRLQLRHCLAVPYVDRAIATAQQMTIVGSEAHRPIDLFPFQDAKFSIVGEIPNFDFVSIADGNL